MRAPRTGGRRRVGAVLLLGTCFALVAGDPRPARGFDRDAVFGAAGLLESAELALESGDLLTAERDARSAVEIYATNLQDTHMWTAAARLTLGMVLVEAGDYPGALEQLDRAVPTFRMFFGGDDSMPAVHLANLGALYAQAGEYGQGLSFVREAVAALEATGDETALAEVRLNEAQILRVIGDYAGAERLLTETLDSARIRVLLPHRLPDLAFLIAELRLNLANTAGARASLEEALADSDLLDPADRRQLRAEALRLEGDITRKEGDPVRAVELGERAVEQLADLLGPTDSTTRQARNSLALSLQDAGRHGEALAILQDLVAGLEEAFPGGHPDLAVAWTSTAWNAWLVGDRALAMELYGRAVEAQLGRPTLAVGLAGTLLSRGQLWLDLGNPELGRQDFEEADKLFRAAYPGIHPDLAYTAAGLAAAARQRNDALVAREQMEEAIRILGSTLGDSHPDLATLYNDFAIEVGRYGDHRAARELHEKALGIRLAALPPDHPDVLMSRSNLAVVLIELEETELAREQLDQVALILGLPERPVSCDEPGPGIATHWENRGLLRAAEGEWGGAAAAHRCATTIREADPLSDPVDIATSRNNAANMFLLQGRLEEASREYERAVHLLRERGRLGGDATQVLSNLAATRRFQGRGDDALAFALEAEALAHRTTRAGLVILRADQRMVHVADQRGHLDLVLSLALEDQGSGVASPDSDRASDDRVAEAVWRWKGLVQAATARERAVAIDEGDPRTAELYVDLAAQRRELALETLAGPGRDTATDWEERVDALERAVLDREQELARTSSAFDRATRYREVTAAQVRAAIPPDAVFVDVLRFGRMLLEEERIVGLRRTELDWQPWYAAVVCTRERTWITDLGPADPMDDTARRFTTAAATIGSTHQSLLESSAISAPSDGEPTTLLRALLEDPLASMGSAERLPPDIWLRPDGALAAIPVAALPLEGGSYLGQGSTVVHVATIGQILDPPLPTPARSNDMLAVGDPAFPGDGDVSCRGSHRTAEGKPLPDDELPSVLELMACSRPVARRWCPLPGTGAELQAIQETFDRSGGESTVLAGDEATRGRVLRELPGHTYAHVGTHGYFLPDVCVQRLVSGRQRADLFESQGVSNDSTGIVLPRLGAMDPWALSGLVFPDPQGGVEPELLPSSDILTLDLRGTRLVTLSACDTGRGQITEGEGVLGLRSAFVLAGAEGLVLSLWQLEDAGTARFMGRFYEELLAEDSPSVEEALRRTMVVSIEGRDGFEALPPSVWGAFTYTGAPASRRPHAAGD